MKIIISMATHGDEHIGFYVRDRLKHLQLDSEQVEFIIGNPAAYAAGQRFTESDLNRSFPGLADGTIEERRAYELGPAIRNADVVIDIHSTTSDLKNTLIVTSLTQKTLEYIRIISPETVLLMNVGADKALISGAPVGLAFEYGTDTDADAITRVAQDVEKILTYSGVVTSTNHTITPNTGNSRFFNVFALAPKPPDYELLPEILNYVEVKKNSNYAYCKDTKSYLKAESDFYPILFGEKKYKTYFGFMATLINPSEISSQVVQDKPKI